MNGPLSGVGIRHADQLVVEDRRRRRCNVCHRRNRDARGLTQMVSAASLAITGGLGIRADSCLLVCGSTLRSLRYVSLLPPDVDTIWCKTYEDHMRCTTF